MAGRCCTFPVEQAPYDEIGKTCGWVLVSADRQLLGTGLAETPTDIATRLNLPTT